MTCPAVPTTDPGQRIGGTCFAVHKADVAAVVTTSDFTKQARTLAATLGIVLFGSDALGG